ncbi:MAG: hypothetical protein K5919_09925 [Clostridiales bacterium]|nr:hypothetical protein [Clostridiales bacterium]
MKRLISILLTALLLLACVPALAEGASLPKDSEDFIPHEVRQFFADSQFNGWQVKAGASRYFENTAGGTYFFTVAQKDGHNVLYGFEEKNGKFNYWLKTDNAIPQGDGFFLVDQLYGEHYMVWFDDPVYIGDTLSILFTRADNEEQADSGVWFEVNKNGQWNLTWAFFDYCWDGAKVGSDAVTYYLDEGSKVNTVNGVTERNLRYFSWDAFPKTMKDAKEALSVPPAIPTGELAAQRIKFEGGQKFPVYSGPGPQYERAAGGRAAVSTNDWIQVFGSENGYILIQYDITSSQMRFGWIEQSALPRGASVSPLRFEYSDASLAAASFLTDDPLNSQTRVRILNPGQAVKWLAVMGQWAYVEITDQGLPVRGFVPVSAVRRVPAQAVYGGEYRGADYSAHAQAEVTAGTEVRVTVRVQGPASWSQENADALLGYQLYANQTLLTAPCEDTPNPGAWDHTFTLSATLPEGTAVLGLCPVYRSGGTRIAEMITVPLTAQKTEK